MRGELSEQSEIRVSPRKLMTSIHVVCSNGSARDSSARYLRYYHCTVLRQERRVSTEQTSTGYIARHKRRRKWKANPILYPQCNAASCHSLTVRPFPHCRWSLIGCKDDSFNSPTAAGQVTSCCIFGGAILSASISFGQFRSRLDGIDELSTHPEELG